MDVSDICALVQHLYNNVFHLKVHNTYVILNSLNLKKKKVEDDINLFSLLEEYSNLSQMCISISVLSL